MLADTLKALLLLCLIQAARTVADPVKGRAPGSSEQLHRSGERKHGRSAPLNASPPNSLRWGVWGSSSAPRSRALGGKSGMTRAEPLVFRYGGSKGNHSPWPHNVRNCSLQMGRLKAESN